MRRVDVRDGRDPSLHGARLAALTKGRQVETYCLRISGKRFQSVCEAPTFEIRPVRLVRPKGVRRLGLMCELLCSDSEIAEAVAN